MKQKAKGLGDSGIMPVSGNEEPGVVARQSSNSSCVPPIKKRYSMLYTRAPIHPDPSFSNENESKTKDSGSGQRSTLDCCDSTGKSETNPNTRNMNSPTNAVVETLVHANAGTVVRPSGTFEANVDSQSTMLPFLSISPEANANTSSVPSRNVEDQVKPALAEKLAIGTTIVSVVVAKQGESHNKFELAADSGHVELSLGSNKPHVSSLVDPNTKVGTVNPSLLPNKGKDISEEGSCKSNIDDSAFIDRCNWDLNTTMDLWIKDASQIDVLGKTSSSIDRKPAISSASVVGSNGDKGKQVVETLVQANAGTAVRPGGTFKANVVETEVVRQNMQSSELLEQKPVKCESIQEEISDVIVPQLVGRVLQRQESSSSTPSDHTYALDQENADIAAKNANFELKVLNVSSDKVKASVSASMNIEDHTVYKTTLNLVTSGKGSSNDEEKYEDGEIREPMMQSYADFLKRCDEKAEKLIWSSRRESEISLSNKRCGKVIYYMEEEKFHRRRNRFQDRSFGSSRGNFMRGRGRGWGRERNFESYGGVADYRFRHQRTAPWLNGASFARDPVYSHQKSMYDGPDGHFVQGNTKFTAMQRSRGFPQMRSKSPVRSLTWSSPQRRLTERFNDHQGSSQHRSPFMYREDRMRSSPQTSKAIAPQRRDSSSYTPYRLNHDTRDVYAVQEHRHPRSLSSRRSPPGRFPELCSDDRRKYGKGQMRNVEGGQSEQLRHEDKFDVSTLKKRRF